MKKIALVIVVVLLVISGWMMLTKQNSSSSSLAVSSFISQVTPTPAPVATKDTLLFVPYWTLSQKDLPTFQSYAYFGITLDENGIATADDGYKNLKTFLQKVPKGKPILLTVRMLNHDFNEKMLEDRNIQAHIVTQVSTFAKENGFNGVILDFEYKAIAFDSVIKSITQFSTDFADSMKEKDLLSYQAIYGDAFYRLRPFDVQEIAQHTDGILVMAYDLHKAGADAGPNFPLESTIDYTFPMMLDDFLKHVPAQRLTVILGMFGYDWTVNNKGLTIGQADALTDNETAHVFSGTCAYNNCVVEKKDALSATHVTYSDEKGSKHEVWFDDSSILQQKKDMIGKKGIQNIGYWAYSYF